MYDIFLMNKENYLTFTRERVIENAILDISFPIRIEYKREENIIKIEIKLEKEKMSKLSIVDIFNSIKQPYDLDRIFLIGEGTIELKDDNLLEDRIVYDKRGVKIASLKI